MQHSITRRDRARFVPAAPAGSLARKRLDDLWSDAVGRVVRVVAPGGYGKTSQIARWVAGDTRHVGWLDVERIDNDPSALLEAIGGTLADPRGARGLDISALPRGPRDAEGFVAEVVPEFAALVRAFRPPFVLVLDDVHHLESPGSTALIDALAANLPPASTLVLAGRSELAGGAIPRLRLHPGVLDVGVADLMLEPAEAGELLASMGIEVDADELHALTARFEGWPAGLRLAGLALRDGGDPEWATPADAGDAAFVTDYLRAEWTARLAPDERRFLQEAACLDRFTGPMCDDVLGRRGSTALLRHLHRGDLVVLPLDRRDEWFRMHPLLANWLSTELEVADVERWRAVHRAAARWWEAHGDVDLAFEHALVIGDVPSCERLVDAYAGALLARGMYATVERWLRSFPTDVALSSPTICAHASLVAAQMGQGDRALQWSRALTRIAEGRDAGVVPAAVVLADVMRAVIEPRPAAELVAYGERARRQLEPGVWRVLACWSVGALQFLAGDVDAARVVLDEGAFEAEVVGAPLLWANLLATGALIADLGGDRENVERDGRRAAEILHAHRFDEIRSTVLVTVVDTLLQARAGRVDGAQAGVAAARRDISGFEHVAPWLNVLSRLGLVRACLLIDDRRTARALLDEVVRHLRNEPADNGAAPHVAELRRRLDATDHVLPTGTGSLTTAELRVVQFLPTNLSLVDIAARLFVSRNTVKSHVAAIYRKLGVATRAEAVELARAAGIVDEHRP